MSNPDGSPTAAEISDATKRGVTWVKVRQYRGVTVDLGNGDYAFSPGDWVAIPTYAVEQLEIDRMVF